MNIELSSFFFILSAADMQWNDLYAHAFKFLKKKYEEVVNELVKTIIACRFLQKNPHVVTKYLNIRFQIFFNEVLKKKFSIQNHWYRFEWQSRSNNHIYEFLWIENVFINDQKQNFVDYWGAKMIALNLNVIFSSTNVYFSSRRFVEQDNIIFQLTKWLNHYQRHTKCTSQYCQWQKKNDSFKDLICRFHFFQKHFNESRLDHKLNFKHLIIKSIQNNNLLDKYNSLFIVNWNVNTDAFFCDDVNSVMIYLFKYIVKEKKRFFKFVELDRQLLNIIKFEINHFLRSYVIKLMNKTLIKRNWFAQKICHIFLNLNFRNFFKSIQSLNFRFLEQQRHVMSFQKNNDSNNDKIKLSIIKLKKYCRRSSNFKNMTLYQFVRNHQWQINVFKSINRSFAVNVYFKYKNKKIFENFCRTKLMLHHSFHQINFQKLLIFNDAIYKIWQNIYERCYA